MLRRIVILAFGFAVMAALAGPGAADAQLLKKIKDRAKNAAEDEAARQVAGRVQRGVRCVFDDFDCIEGAESSGEDVVLTDDSGNVIADDDGAPITDPDEAATKAATRPGEGAWANYDFVPGDRVLFYEDYENDNVGDFPRRLEFLRGNWEVVEWEGRRLLRNTGPRHAAFKIVLPEALPEQFTIEFEAHLPHGNHQVVVLPITPENDAWENYQGSFFQLDGRAMGVKDRDRNAPQAVTRERALNETLAPVRIMVDGRYAKFYVGERRVSNMPNAALSRGNVLQFQNTNFADDENPVLIGPIRVAAGGKDLYDVLEAEGRVTTRGILFATGSDRIRPESTPTLKEIGDMLEGHTDLRISIEGHTDSDGDDAYNQDLSERRAASVRAYLVERHGIDGGRLETKGFGESRPVADNGTPEGKQQNRRVELVNLSANGGGGAGTS